MNKRIAVLCGMLSCATYAAPLWAQVENVNPAGEMQLQKMSPAVKRFTIKLEGSVREQSALNDIERIIRDIFNNSRIGTVAVLVSGEPVASDVRVYENLEIVVNAKTAEEEGQPYRVNITLQERGTASGEPKRFDYLPVQAEMFHQELSAYLSKELNLKPKPRAIVAPAPVVTPPVTNTPAVETSSTMVTTAPVVATPPAVTNTPKMVASPNDGPAYVNPADEIQLQNVTPTVKRFAIKLEGSVREQNALTDIERMIRQIFRESRIGSVTVPVSGSPVAIQNKVYENLEIVVNAKTAEEADKPYAVNLTLREAGSTGGAPVPFSYAPAYPDIFYQGLKAYLSKELNLQPK